MNAALPLPQQNAGGGRNAETAVRCMHLDEAGGQCPLEAVEGTQLCPDHTRFLEPDGESRRPTPLLYRLVALVLLLIFLYNYYQVVLSGWVE